MTSGRTRGFLVVPKRPEVLMRMLPVRFAAFLVVMLVAIVALGPSAAPPAAADQPREDVPNNYFIEIPDNWKWSDSGADWAKHGIRARGFRELETFRRQAPKPGGAPGQMLTPDGQGAEVVISVLDAPEGKSLEEIASDPLTRQFLLGRFGEDSTKWPTVEVDNLKKVTVQQGARPDQEPDPLPGILLTAVGEARNLKGVLNPKSKGMLILTIARKKLYRVRLYAWPSQWDDEGLKDDIDGIELSFEILSSHTPPKEGTKPAAGDPANGGGEPAKDDPALQGDDGRAVTYGKKIQRWKLVKPPGIQVGEIKTEETVNRQVFFESYAKDGSGGYQVTLDVYPITTVDDKGVKHEGDMKSQISTNWWGHFVQQHPEGEIFTLNWPKKKKFIVLPELEPIVPVVKAEEKRPPEMDHAAFEKKKIVEEVKNVKLGKEKVDDAWRAVLCGNLARSGKHIVLRFYWKTVTHGFEMYVSLTGDAWKVHREKLQTLFDSIEILDK